ncbi:MAG: hypothetical protein OHK0045_23980 [Raineya sp.]
MNKLECILCKSNDIEELEVLDIKILADLYKKRAKVDVSRFFTQPTISLCRCNHCKLLFYNPIILGDGKFYEDLQNYEGYYLEEKSDYIEAKKYIGSSDDVLEVGCGAGFFTNFIQPKSYTGLEFNDKAIELAQKKGLNVKKQSLEAHAAENPEKYDVVCFFQVLEHVDNPGNFLRDALKCLKKGGKMIFAVPAEDSFMQMSLNSYLNMPPHHTARYPDFTLRSIAKMFEIQLIEIIYETIQPIHREFYLKTTMFNRLRKILNMPQKSLDNSLASNALYALVWIAAKVIAKFKSLKNIQGVSVVAIYSK